MLVSQDKYVNSRCRWFDIFGIDLRTHHFIKWRPLELLVLSGADHHCGSAIVHTFKTNPVELTCKSRRRSVCGDVGQVHSYRHTGQSCHTWDSRFVSEGISITWHAPDMLIRSQFVACIYFSRRRAPRTVMVWKSGAIRCHWKTGVIRGLKLVLSSCFGPFPCSWNWRWWSTWERYEMETSCST